MYGHKKWEDETKDIDKLPTICLSKSWVFWILKALQYDIIPRPKVPTERAVPYSKALKASCVGTLVVFIICLKSDVLSSYLRNCFAPNIALPRKKVNDEEMYKIS